MKIEFLIAQLGHQLFLNQQETNTYQQLQQQKFHLVQELYAMMVQDGDV